MATVLRRYEEHDAAATAEAFQEAIRVTAAKHYSPAQVDAWAGGVIDLVAWSARRAAAWTVVAEADGDVVGFSDLTSDGELDMLFVHPVAAGRGFARLLVEAVLGEARQRGLRTVGTRASRAARPAFERLGFVVDAENTENRVRGVRVPNYDMHVDL